VQAAVDFIKAHPGQVGLVTLNTGGADLIPLLPHALEDPAGTAAKLPGIFKAFQGNLDASLNALHAALGSTGKVVVATQYNPLGGIASPPLPAGLPAIASGAIGSMNNLIKSVAAADGAQVADVAAAFDANPGGAALLTFVPTTLAGAVPDIYPLPEGYRLYAQTVLRATGFVAPLKLTAKLKRKSVKHGGTDGVAGKTTTDATITVKLKLPGKHTDSTSLVADNAGSYSWSFTPEAHAGKGSLRVCATDPVSGKSLCSKKLSFSVR
jgi:phage tail protein X